jgi:hypothetical protein
MSFAEIEAELEKMAPDQLRRLALRSWSAYLEKEARPEAADKCDEDDPLVLAALDNATQQADASPNRCYSGAQVRSRLSKWFSK